MNSAGSIRSEQLAVPPAAINRARGARRGGAAALIAGLAMLLVLFAAGLVMIPRYRAIHPPTPLQQSDSNRVRVDDIYLDLTLVTPAFMRTRHLERYVDHDLSKALPILVGINTHRGDLSHMHHLHGSFLLLGSDGARYPSLSAPIVLSEHHDAYLILFPARDNEGRAFLGARAGKLVVEARDVGARRLRRFEWKMPLEDDAERLLSPHDAASTLALAVALVSALIVVLSPCALELTLYYSAIISCTVADGERASVLSGCGPGAAAGRRRLLLNLASFVGGFTLLYAASGASVGLVGQEIRMPLAQYGTAIQAIGGTLILLFAMRVMGVNDLVRTRLGALPRVSLPLPLKRLARMPGAILTRARMAGMRRRSESGGMRPIDSFLVGVGLSTSCLTCMGGAVLYPLLVYAGITSWYSGLITLGLYSLAIAVPMVFIALGFFQIRMSLHARLGFNRWLRRTSGAMLAAIALLVIFGHERIVTDITFALLGTVARWFG